MNKEEKSKNFKAKYNQFKYQFRIFKNKYIFAVTIFSIYALFLDDYDIFNLISQRNKLRKIKLNHELALQKLRHTRFTLKQLTYPSELERYAREEKLFKKDDEDIFILSFE